VKDEKFFEIEIARTEDKLRTLREQHKAVTGGKPAKPVKPAPSKAAAWDCNAELN
jgi:hypothetical protein